MLELAGYDSQRGSNTSNTQIYSNAVMQVIFALFLCRTIVIPPFGNLEINAMLLSTELGIGATE
jgi:hypothetical protein